MSCWPRGGCITALCRPSLPEALLPISLRPHFAPPSSGCAPHTPPTGHDSRNLESDLASKAWGLDNPRLTKSTGRQTHGIRSRSDTWAPCTISTVKCLGPFHRLGASPMAAVCPERTRTAQIDPSGGLRNHQHTVYIYIYIIRKLWETTSPVMKPTCGKRGFLSRARGNFNPRTTHLASHLLDMSTGVSHTQSVLPVSVVRFEIKQQKHRKLEKGTLQTQQVLFPPVPQHGAQKVFQDRSCRPRLIKPGLPGGEDTGGVATKALGDLQTTGRRLKRVALQISRLGLGRGCDYGCTHK